MIRSDRPAIKAIILDYGDVLTAPADREATRTHRLRLARKLAMPVEELWKYLFEGEPARRWMTGQIDWDEFWIEVLAAKGITDPAEALAFADVVFSGTEQLNSEMVALIKELHGRYLLAVLSNASWTTKELEEKLYNEHELPGGFFDAVVTSTTVGAVKPDRAIYQAALDALGVQPGEAVFTDDLISFVEAAQRIGIHAQLFKSPAGFRDYLVELGVLP
jgi:epoxide hydrolase-like predicted phosphatase